MEQGLSSMIFPAEASGAEEIAGRGARATQELSYK